jgi:hypothetical protein
MPPRRAGRHARRQHRHTAWQPFAASGTVSGLIAGSSDTSTLNVALDTANAGVFSGAATVGLSSRNPELADLALGSQDVLLQGAGQRTGLGRPGPVRTAAAAWAAVRRPSRWTLARWRRAAAQPAAPR